MSNANEVLARRWPTSKHWGGWRMGMVSTTGWVCFDDEIEPLDPSKCAPIPDLDHPGTRAFLLEDVRRAWGDAVRWESGPNGHHVVMRGCQWFNPGKCVGKGKTEAAALIAALEAAP